MTEQANRVEVTAIRWLIRPRRRDAIYLAEVDYRLIDAPAYVGSDCALAGPDGVSMLGREVYDADASDGALAEIMAAVRREVELICPPLGNGSYPVRPDPRPCCRHCERERDPYPLLAVRFIVCQTCGNKRCPKATHHDNACTGSNEPGQPGSAYE